MNTFLAAGGTKELKKKGINFEDKNSMSDYYMQSRYKAFSTCCHFIKKYPDIKSCLDIATSSGHFVYVANENNIDCYGFDLEFDETNNQIFESKFHKKALFRHDLNNLLNIKNNYDIYTNFHLTHIFTYQSFLYLLKILSNKTKYAYLHINNNIIENIKKLPFITPIEVIDNGVHGSFLFLKFKNEITNIPKMIFYRIGMKIFIKK